MTRIPMVGTILMCPECASVRTEKQGLSAQGKDVCYLGCECPAPSGIMSLLPSRLRLPEQEIVDYLARAVLLKRLMPLVVGKGGPLG